jgi:uncharacterized protein (TIGR02996 family)
MTHDEAFVQAIREAPEDDAPRLIYADWLEEYGRPERAEFIRVQCARADGSADEPQAEALRQRAEALLEQSWESWVGPLRELVGPHASRRGEAWLANGYHPAALSCFCRGFVDALTLDADTLLEQTQTLACLVPLRHLRLWGAGRRAAELAACPFLDGVSELDFLDYFDSPLTAGGACALAQSPYLGQLTALSLYRNNVSDRGVEALARAPWFSGLQALNLSDNGVSAAAIRLLATVRPHLTVLRLGDNAMGPEAVEVMAASEPGCLQTLDLHRNPLGDRGAAALAEAPFLRTLASLDLSSCEVGDAGAAALARSPHLAGLRLLELNRNRITDRGARALAASPHLVRLEALGLEGNAALRLVAGPAALAYASYLRRLNSAHAHPWGPAR